MKLTRHIWPLPSRCEKTLRLSSASESSTLTITTQSDIAHPFSRYEDVSSTSEYLTLSHNGARCKYQIIVTLYSQTHLNINWNIFLNNHRLFILLARLWSWFKWVSLIQSQPCPRGPPFPFKYVLGPTSQEKCSLETINSFLSVFVLCSPLYPHTWRTQKLLRVERRSRIKII